MSFQKKEGTIIVHVKNDLIPEFQQLFNLIEPEEKIKGVVEKLTPENQKKIFEALKEIIPDDIVLILTAYYSHNLQKEKQGK